MNIVLAEHAGFCYGVSRAVEKALDRLQGPGPVFTLGPLIHNPQVVHLLKEQGAREVEDAREVTGGTVIMRCHGSPPSVREGLIERGIEVLDVTCPHVQVIHNLARIYSKKGYPIIIVGKRTHPEIQGILGCCAVSFVVETVQEASALPQLTRALLVSQTTFVRQTFEDIASLLVRRIDELVVRPTICPATAKRQEAACTLARRVDTMVVVGGRESANTQKLYALCQALCKNTLFVQSADEIPKGFARIGDSIGITAGASTPAWTIKEVVTRMNDMEKQDMEMTAKQDETLPQEESKPQEETTPQEVAQTSQTIAPAEEAPATLSDDEEMQPTMEEAFETAFEKTMVKIRTGQTVSGTIVQITEDEVCVNIGYKSDGIVKRTDLTTEDELHIGDEIEVEVVKVNDGEGNVLLSQRSIVSRKNWGKIVAAYEAGELIDAVGKEAVKGGLLAMVMGIRTFIPASQLSQRYVENIAEFVGQPMKLKIIEMDKSKKRIVASRKVVLMEEEALKRKEIWKTLELGSTVSGVVRRLTDFGAFVDIGGIDGLVHLTELSWGRIKHASDVVSVGQEIQVKILALDEERGRISLGYKQLGPRPWDTASEKFIKDSIVTGKVVRIVPFGAFVELGVGLDGLVHISQCSPRRINRVEEAVSVGDFVRVKVLDVNPEAKRISLSIRAAMEEEDYDLPMSDVADTDAAFVDSVPELPTEEDDILAVEEAPDAE